MFLFKADVGGRGGRACQKITLKICYSVWNVLAFEFRVVLGGCFRTWHEVVQSV